MELRNHPLMSYKGIPNWPPVWVRTDKLNERVTGEIGTLVEVRRSTSQSPPYECFLVVEHNDATYIGCLLFHDRSFCGQIFNLLQNYYGYSIQSIGSLDLSHTL